MLVSLPFAWIYLLPDSFINFSKSILYSIGFTSNLYFHFTEQQYGAESSEVFFITHMVIVGRGAILYFYFNSFIVCFQIFKKYLIYILIFGFF